MKKQLTLLLLSLLTFVLVHAETGTIRGVVTDNTSGETMIGVNVVIDGTTIGTTTDLDGAYNLKVEEGTHTVVFSFLSYETQKISDVRVIAGKVTALNLQLKEAVQEVGVVEVTAKAVQKSDAAILTVQRKSANVLDGISSQTFSKTGDGDAASAIKRVTGVSVEGGKHVFVRGLGDRYTKSILNGTEIPGLDPERNNIQMDMFPTNVIDNILVYKTFTPDLPGDFTGGVVNIVTADFPESRSLQLSASWSYNPSMHFKSQYLTYKKSSTDFLGFDNGLRKLPFDKDAVIPDEAEQSEELSAMTKGFGDEMTAKRKMSFMDQSYSIAYGNQYNKEKMNIGMNFILNYSNEYRYYQDVKFGYHKKNPDPAITNLDLDKVTLEGETGENSSLWSALALFSFKKQKSKYSINLLHVQNGISEAGKFTQYDNFNSAVLIKNNLQFTQRSVSNLLIAGEHQTKRININWKNSTSYSAIKDPDIRNSALEVIDDTTYRLNEGNGAKLTRIWRNLGEVSNNLKLDMEQIFTFKSGKKTKLNYGLSDVLKYRDFSVLNYNFRVRGLTDLNENTDVLFSDENVWTPENRVGTYVVGGTEPANQYQSMSNVAALYVMNEMPITKKFKAIYGVRVEKANIWYTGQNNFGNVVYDFTPVLNNIDVLPAVNLVYELKDKMNLRAAYSMTVARPSFKEISIAQIYDPLQNNVFIGNIDLKQTNIQNADLRWEYFLGRNQIISTSAFYKYLKNPIEMVAFPEAPSNVQPRNVGNGMLAGAEIELRKNFDFISKKLEDLSIGTNFTYVYSRMKMNETEYEGRLANKRDGEEIKDTRAMSGQPPYIINAYLNYSNDKLKLEANLNYNMQAKRIAIVGSGRVPDVYELPFHNLGFSLAKSLGKNDQWKIKVNASNLLGSKFVQQYESYGNETAVYHSYNPGRSFGFGVSYTLK